MRTLLLAFATYAQETTARNVTAVYSPANGIGPEQGVMRRDPSDIIQVGDLYYVWFSKGKIASGYDATVWYATSPDGCKWSEKGMAIGKGEPRTWDGASVFAPNILVAEGRYWLFYSGVSKKFGMDDRVCGAWLSLAQRIAPQATGLDGSKTHGDFIRRAWRQR